MPKNQSTSQKPIDDATNEANPFKAAFAASMFETAKKYRSNCKRDVQWKVCFQHDEAYNEEVANAAGDTNNHALRLPITRNNNRRKVASIGSATVQPLVYTEDFDTTNFASVRQKVLRWAVRNSGLKDAAGLSRRQGVSINHGIAQCSWDQDALEGKGCPTWEVKDPRNVYLDPRRRQWDINKDCRWIFERQTYTLSELKSVWPKHFEDHAPQKTDLRVTDATNTEEILDAFAPEEGGLYDIILCEFVAKVDGRKRVFTGIFDPGQTSETASWIVEPRDNGLGMFSYAINGSPPAPGQAYPTPSNLAEHEQERLVNLAYTLAVRTGLKNADPPVLFDATDSYLFDRFTKGEKTIKPGEWIPFLGQNPPQQMKVTSPDIFFEIAREMHAQANDAADVQAVQRGEAPRGVSSGKAINALASFADASLDEYRQNEERFYVQACTIMDRMMQSKIKEFRAMVYQDGPQLGSTVVNVPSDHPAFQDMRPVAGEDGSPVYVSARGYRNGDVNPETQLPERIYVASMSLAEARSQIETGEIDDFEEWLNDLTLGNLEVTVEMEPTRDRAQRQQLAALLLQTMGPGILRWALTEMGVETVDEVMNEVEANDQLQQLGKLLESNPELAQALQILQQDPVLLQLITNPAASGRLRLALAKHASPPKQPAGA